jgi:hypothetical protein
MKNRRLPRSNKTEWLVDDDDNDDDDGARRSGNE